MRMFFLIVFQFLGLGFVLAAGVSKKKQAILFLTLLANVCSTFVMFLAGRYDGAAATIVCTVRSFVYIFQKRWKGDGLFWICITAHIVVGLAAWQSARSILTIAAPVVLCYVSRFGSVRTIKLGTIFSDACWAVFDFSCGVYIEGARDLADAASNVIGLIRERRGAAAV